jgi:CheY-like chemotaxis protein
MWLANAILLTHSGVELCPLAKRRIMIGKGNDRGYTVAIKILVVDSSAVTERLSKETLTPLGCQIITASSTALAVFLARKNFPSLIINGVRRQDEIDLPAEIRTDQELAHIPVVVVADNGDDRTLERGRLSGAAKVLALPLSPERFFEELRPFLIESEDDRPDDTPE